MGGPWQAGGSDAVDDPPLAHNGGRPDRARALAHARRRDEPGAVLARADTADPTTYEQILAALPLTERRIVHDAVVSSVIDGDIPDVNSVARLADFVEGKITGEQYRAEVLDSLRSR